MSSFLFDRMAPLCEHTHVAPRGAGKSRSSLGSQGGLNSHTMLGHI